MELLVLLSVLLTKSDCLIPSKSQNPSSGLIPDQSRATVYHVQDSSRSFPSLSDFTTGSPIQEPVKSSLEDAMLEEAMPLIGGRSESKSRRDVPSSSYGRTGEGGVAAFRPGEDPPNSTESSEDSQTDDGTLSKPSDDEGQTSEEKFFTASDTKETADKDVSSSGDQKPLEAGEQKQGLKGQFSYPAIDGSIVETNWTIDKGGFKVQGTFLPVFQLGLGRR